MTYYVGDVVRVTGDRCRWAHHFRPGLVGVITETYPHPSSKVGPGYRVVALDDQAWSYRPDYDGSYGPEWNVGEYDLELVDIDEAGNEADAALEALAFPERT